MSQSPKAAHLFTIAAGLPFADTLAAGLLGRAGGDPLQLARMLVLLPTRRACRSVREAFLRQTEGKPLLLPRLQPIGDIDDEELTLQAEPGVGANADTPPSIDGLRRQLLLAKHILERSDNSAEQAAALAASLADLLDQMQTERVAFSALAGLVPDELAEHWQQTLKFLSILTDDWPALLAAESAIDPATRRDTMLTTQAQRWRNAPPDFPVIAAGSTGTIPATADLLAAIAALPNGAVILPGLDRRLDDSAWEALDATHPQFGMARLLDHLGVDRAAVNDWPTEIAVADNVGVARAALVNEALRPAETTERWREDAADAGLYDAFATPLVYVECPTPREEAGVIALALRETLETKGRTAALITPDRQLARRVAAELRRWNVEIDDSAGTPLGATPPGAFLRLIAQAAASDWSPVALLAVLKHPLASLGQSQGNFRANVRTLEIALVRGPRPAPGFAGLQARLAQLLADEDIKPERAALLVELLEKLQAATAPLDALMAQTSVTLPTLVRAHVTVAQALAASDDGRGADRLWAGDNGEAAGRYVADLDSAAVDFPAIPPRQYGDLFTSFMLGINVRPRVGRHPRLAILGLLEARLVRHDRMILAGLNEGTWPALPAADPWLSRPMRAQLGLSPPERRIGLAAHDFAQAFTARDIMLTRSLRVGGAPTVPSRFLLRLESLLKALGVVERTPGAGLAPDAKRHIGCLQWRGSAHLRWHASLGETLAPATFAQPSFAPPRSARPKEMSVTQVEMLRRDPYAYYARHILRLEAVEPLEADIDAAERGTIVHTALDTFLQRYPSGPLPAGAERELLVIGRTVYGNRLDEPAVRTFWWPRFERIAQWFIAEETRRRIDLDHSFGERRGERDMVFGEHRLTLSARADRIDRRRDGSLVIVDYKTGAVPSVTDVNQGYAPQLPLEALLAREGGFEGIDKDAAIAALEYWRLTGGDAAGLVVPAGGKRATVEELIESYRGRLHKLVAYFADPTHAYLARPRARFALRYNDYEHLERISEWSSLGEATES